MNQTLNEAIVTRDAARAKLAAAQDATAHGRATVNAARAEVERLADEEARWIERHAKRLEERARAGQDGAPDLVPTDKAIIAKRTADVTLTAAEQATRRLEADEQIARTELASAEAAVSKAADAEFDAETRADLEAFLPAWEAMLRRRERLITRYAVRASGLTDREWLRLSQHPEVLTGAHLGIGEPLVGWSIYDSDHPYARNNAAAQGRAAAFVAEHRQRLEQLRTHGDLDSVCPAQDAA
jgi:hypothetical protein